MFKKLFFIFVFLILAETKAATSEQCLNGSFTACKEVFNKFGSQSDKNGAVELFEKACSSQLLKVSCLTTSVLKENTLQKSLELSKPNSGLFVISGNKIDKIYQISESK